MLFFTFSLKFFRKLTLSGTPSPIANIEYIFLLPTGRITCVLLLLRSFISMRHQKTVYSSINIFLLTDVKENFSQVECGGANFGTKQWLILTTIVSDND